MPAGWEGVPEAQHWYRATGLYDRRGEHGWVHYYVSAEYGYGSGQPVDLVVTQFIQADVPPDAGGEVWREYSFALWLAEGASGARITFDKADFPRLLAWAGAQHRGLSPELAALVIARQLCAAYAMPGALHGTADIRPSSTALLRLNGAAAAETVETAELGPSVA
jgi:hypothetical protein